jgi:3-oxoacyl-[acyl-carrier protein] reductase
MNLNLSERHALVCGSTQGIGKAAAVELASLGATVTLVARDEKKLKRVKEELDRLSGKVHHYAVVDFLDSVSVGKQAESIASKRQVHILVNNTGGPPGGPALDASPEEFLRAFQQHLVCNQLLTQAVVPGMKAAGYGRIINVISTSVKVPIRGLGVSNTIRGAVANWAKTISVELAPFGITVNNVLPGATVTGRLEALIQSKAEKSGRTPEAVRHEMIEEIPAGRLADATEVATAIAFLASPAAGYINGINLPVDGGRTGAL